MELICIVLIFTSLSLGFKVGEKDSILEKKNYHLSAQYHYNNLSISDDLQHLIDYSDYSPETIEKILIIFKKFRLYFFSLIMLEIIVNSLLCYNTWIGRYKLFIVIF